MKIALRLIALSLVLTTCAFVKPVRTSENLQFSPKEGDRFRFMMTGRLRFAGTSADVSADMDCRVTRVDNDRAFTMATSQTNSSATVSGQKVDLPNYSYTTVNKENGELLEFHADTIDATSWRMMVLKRFIYPPKRVSIGDEWTSSVTADSHRGTVSAISTFKMESLEKIGRRNTAKVKFSCQEKEGAQPASSDGFTWIDTSDGSVVKNETTLLNAPSPQGLINGKMMLERV